MALTAAEYNRQVARFLADKGRMPTQDVECMECHGVWLGIPFGFIYDDPAAGWRQDYLAQHISGYCKPCAARIADQDHENYRNGHWERRTIEDETYVWDR